MATQSGRPASSSADTVRIDGALRAAGEPLSGTGGRGQTGSAGSGHRDGKGGDGAHGVGGRGAASGTGEDRQAREGAVRRGNRRRAAAVSRTRVYVPPL